MNISQTITHMLCEQLETEPDRIHPHSTLTDDLGADSLDLAQLMMQIEDHFDCVISSEQSDTMKTVADIVEWLEQQGATHG